MPRILRFILSLSLLAALPSFAQGTISGTVTNKTNNKPSAGDDVTLIRLAQGMQDSTHTTTDSRGRFKLQVPESGMHLIRVTHQKANYFRPAPPGTDSVEVDVYDAAEHVEGVSLGVEELHVEATDNELHIVEVLQVLNQSSPARTQFGPNGYDFYLPAGARVVRTGAITEGGMPVQSPAIPVGDPDHYRFLFPLRPGETQFGIVYTLPYAKSFTFNPKLASPAATFAVLLPKSMKLTPGSGTQLAPSNSSPDAQTFVAQNVVPSQPLSFTVSGTGSLPQKSATQSDGSAGDQNGAQTAPQPGAAAADTRPGGGLGNPLDPNADNDPWAKYKGWILGGLALILAIAAGVLLRRPPAPDVQALPESQLLPATHKARLQQVLKEELFTLETERLQKQISDADYQAHKNALDFILLRALSRDTDTPATGTRA